MKAFVAQGLSKDAVLAKIDLSAVERRFTHGDPFLTNRFRDYVASAGLLDAAYAAETGKGPAEVFDRRIRATIWGPPVRAPAGIT